MCNPPPSRATTRRRGSAAVVVGAALAVLLTMSAVRAQASLEYQVKASYLYNFMQFIEWPADALARSPTFNLCVVGPARFGSALVPLTGERVQGRKVALRALARPGDARAGACHILLVGQDEQQADEPPPHARGMLTVGEAPGFLARGGVINLVAFRGRIRFQVNRGAAERAGLVLSSRLLRLALNSQ